jgi:hypothetical protein
MKARILSLGCAVVLAAGCGSDSDPKQACNELVDAFSNAWARCGRMTYEAAKQNFSTQFSSCNPSSVDQAKVDQCSADLGTADCAVIKNGGTPASCQGVLAQ